MNVGSSLAERVVIIIFFIIIINRKSCSDPWHTPRSNPSWEMLFLSGRVGEIACIEGVLFAFKIMIQQFNVHRSLRD